MFWLENALGGIIQRNMWQKYVDQEVQIKFDHIDIVVLKI